MSAVIRCAGLLAGVSTVVVLGVAIAQSEPPNPLIGNAAIGAGQQSTHNTPMGETGVLLRAPEAPPIIRQEVVVVVPAPVAPAPEPVAAAPEPPTTVALGAPAAPEPAPPVVRADRN
jgi:hypothetical protein